MSGASAPLFLFLSPTLHMYFTAERNDGTEQTGTLDISAVGVDWVPTGATKLASRTSSRTRQHHAVRLRNPELAGFLR